MQYYPPPPLRTIFISSPPTVQTDKAVSQTGHKVLIVVAWAEHQVAVDRQYPQSVQQCHLLSYRLVGSTKLVKHRSIQTVVDGVEGKTLGSSLGLKWKRKWRRQRGNAGLMEIQCVAVTLLHKHRLCGNIKAEIC